MRRMVAANGAFTNRECTTRPGLVLVTLYIFSIFFTIGAANAEQRLALVIGNATYQNIGQLANPLNDAKLMADTLHRLNFDVTLHLDTDQKQMKKALFDFSKKIGDVGTDAVVVVYYAGHGVQINGNNYLIPVDARINYLGEVDIESVNASGIMKLLGNTQRTLNIVILDACRNNPFTRGAQGGLAEVKDAPPRSLVAFSTSPNSLAADGPPGGNSFYTAALANALAATISTPGLSILEVFQKTREKVWEVTKNQQLTWEATSMMGAPFYPGDLSGHHLPPPPLPPSNTFDQTFGRASFSKIIRLASGDYAIAATNGTPDSKKVRLIRIDGDGKMVWEKSFDGDGYTAAASVAAFPNEDLIVAGSTRVSSNSLAKAWLIRTDKQGKLLWSKTYGGAGSNGFYSIVPMPDGGVAVAGLATKGGVSELWVVRCDGDGQVLWERSFRRRNSIATPAIAAMSDGVVVTGTAKDKDDSESEALVFRLDRNGETLWEKHFDENRNAIDAAALPDDSVVIVGLRRKKSYNFASDPWAVKIDGQGKQLWESVFDVHGQFTINAACCVVRGTDGDVTIVGNVSKDQESRIWMASVNGQGVVLSERTLNGNRTEVANGAVQTENGGVITGISGGQDGYSHTGELHVFTTR